jgi:uncharacterized protein (DUF1684 family)
LATFSKLFLLGLSFLGFQMSTPSYKAEIEQWRQLREARLKADGGWLTVAGLFWLKEGENTVGADKAKDIVLPAGSAPASVGVFEFHNDQTQFHAASGVQVLLNGKSATTATLKADSSGPPDAIQLGNLTMFVIQRGKRYGIRLKDTNSEMRKAFTGLNFFAPDERYRVQAKFVPYDPPKMIPVPNILGETEEEASPGYVEFTLDGHACRLDPVTEDDTLFFIFKDLTSGKETYPPGRFLNTPMPENGKVTLDFNKAYNPPCAFTPYATCPLPPKQNQLSIRIEAGELRYGH